MKQQRRGETIRMQCKQLNLHDVVMLLLSNVRCAIVHGVHHGLERGPGLERWLAWLLVRWRQVATTLNKQLQPAFEALCSAIRLTMHVKPASIRLHFARG